MSTAILRRFRLLRMVVPRRSSVLRMVPNDKTPHTLHRTALIATVNACMFVFGVVLLLMGSLLPGLNVSGAKAGSLGSLPLVGILTATVLIGPILDKTGAKPALAVALALIASALAVMPSLSTYSALAVAALVYGIGGGVLNTTTNALIADLSASGRGAALNLLGFSFSLGAIAAPLLMSTASGRLSPTDVVRILAGVSAIVLIPVVTLPFPAAAHAHTRLGSLLRVLRHPLVWVLGVLLFFESGNENCMFVWAGKVTGDLLHLAARRADLALLGLSIALGAGRLLAAFWLQAFGSRNAILLSSAVTAAGAIGVVEKNTLGGLVAGFMVIGLGMSAIYPTALGLAGDRFPAQTGTVFGAIMTVALVGGVAGPMVGGWAAAVNPRVVVAVPLISAVAVAALTLVVSDRKWA
jgi:MFS transporter, FHS family, glucose/mannose:H+ symporter